MSLSLASQPLEVFEELEDLDELFSQAPSALLALGIYARWTGHVVPQQESLLNAWLGLEKEILNEGIAPELAYEVSKNLNTAFDFYVAWQFISDCQRHLSLADQSALARGLFFNGFTRQGRWGK